MAEDHDPDKDEVKAHEVIEIPDDGEGSDMGILPDEDVPDDVSESDSMFEDLLVTSLDDFDGKGKSQQ